MTRFPVPGAVKTRLITEVGASEAARIHRELTEHCARRLRAVELSGAIDLEARVAGPPAGLAPRTRDAGAPPKPRSWPPYVSRRRPQDEGDLGARLAEALRTAIDEGAPAAIAVGSDCPDLGGRQLRAACAALKDHDVVLGPAADGGYYLVGVRAQAAALSSALSSALFGPHIDWGTSAVLEQTLQALRAAGARPPAVLEELNDVDEIADIEVWERSLVQRTPATVSVVIPTLDEEESVVTAIQSAWAAGAHEVIVADASVEPATATASMQAGARVVAATPGRASQMNAGAAAATGDALIFLHADSTLPPRATDMVREALAEPTVSGGGFGFSAGSPDSWLDRLITGFGRMRYALFRLPYGDQAHFVRRCDFDDLGGFPDLPTMEDYEFALRLRALGTLARPNADVHTSTRAWRERGLVRTAVVNMIVIAGYRTHIDPKRLASWRRRASARS